MSVGFSESTVRLLRDARHYPKLVGGRSFSQYAEDSVLFAALNPSNEGFYVDVGAHSPVYGSNTNRLYRNGWSGITIEPNPAATAIFGLKRPRDLHLNIGVSSVAGELTYYEFATTELNTFSAERADRLTRNGERGTGNRAVATRPLSSVLDEHAGGRQVDFISVDCEGFDLEVLKSADLAHWRPTSVLVEDLQGFYAFRRGEEPSEIQRFMRSCDYQPVAQALYSTLYVAKDWRRLFGLSRAFSFGRVQASLLPDW